MIIEKRSTSTKHCAESIKVHFTGGHKWINRAQGNLMTSRECNWEICVLRHRVLPHFVCCSFVFCSFAVGKLMGTVHVKRNTRPLLLCRGSAVNFLYKQSICVGDKYGSQVLTVMGLKTCGRVV
jgi:hypothetical protein